MRSIFSTVAIIILMNNFNERNKVYIYKYITKFVLKIDHLFLCFYTNEHIYRLDLATRSSSSFFLIA